MILARLKSYKWRDVPVNWAACAIPLASIGLYFGCSIQAFDSPDERAHFYRVAQLVQGQLLGERMGSVAGGYFEAPFMEILDPEQPGARFLSFRSTVLYSPVTYAPAAIAFWALFKLGVRSQNVILKGCRLALGLSALILIAFALCVAEDSRVRLLTLLLTLAPGYAARIFIVSADVITHATAHLCFALAIGCSYRRTRFRFFLSLLVSFILGLSKGAYTGLPLLLVPAWWRNDRRAGLALVLTAIVPSLIWAYLQIGVYVPSYGGVDASAQMGRLLDSPLEVMIEISRHLIRRLPEIVRGSVSISDHRPVIRAEYMLSVFYWALTAWLVWNASSEKSQWLSIGHRVLAATVGLLCVYSILGLNYFLQTPTGAGWVQGINGRIFQPLAPLVFFFIPKRSFPTWGRRYGVAFAFSSILAVWLALMTIAIRNRY